MLTGKRAFEGKSQASLITAIMGSEPAPISTVKSMSPPALDHVVTRCLAKDADGRWQSAADLMQELKWVAEGGAVSAVSIERSPARATGERVVWSVAVLALAVLAIWDLMRSSPPPARLVSRLTVDVPEGQRLADTRFSFAPPMTLSPDGTRLVYSATTGGRPQLYLRNLDAFDVEPIPGTEGGTSPFFSPDGQWLGFFAGGKLQKAPLAGGAPQTICDVPAFSGFGATWGADGTIIFAPTLAGLWRVSAEGGDPERLTAPAFEKGEYAHAWPQFLPDGENVLFSVFSKECGAAAILSLERGTWHPVVSQAQGAMYLPTGHIVYGNYRGLFAVTFDPKQLEVGEGSIPVVDNVYYAPYSGRANFAVSENGVLLYEPVRAAQRSLVWVDRGGKETLVIDELAPYLSPAISPDGGRLLFQNSATWGRSIWAYDLERGTRTQVRSDRASAAMWSTDGSRIIFASLDAGGWNLTSKAADGSGEEKTLLDLEGSQYPESWSPDGQTLAYYDYGPTTGRDIWMLPLGGEREPFLVTPFNEYMLQFSPDGRFVAYVSDESGQEEVYVQPYPGPGERTTISTEGGREPVWSRDGRELFYRNGDQMMAVSVSAGDSLTAGKPQLLFTGNYAFDLLRNYDVSPDGERFLMIREDEQTARPRFHVVLNWFEELKRLVPTE